MSIKQMAVPGSKPRKHPTAISPDRQPFSWYASFAEPYPLPDVAATDRKAFTDKEVSEKLKQLNKDLAREEHRSAGLREEVKTWCRSTLASDKVSAVGRMDTPLDELIFDPPLESMTQAAKTAIAQAESQTRMVTIRTQIQELNARVESV